MTGHMKFDIDIDVTVRKWWIFAFATYESPIGVSGWYFCIGPFIII